MDRLATETPVMAYATNTIRLESKKYTQYLICTCLELVQMPNAALAYVTAKPQHSDANYTLVRSAARASLLLLKLPQICERLCSATTSKSYSLQVVLVYVTAQ